MPSQGFRMKEILLDMVEATKKQVPDIEMQLVDFGVVGPGPQRCFKEPHWLQPRMRAV